MPTAKCSLAFHTHFGGQAAIDLELALAGVDPLRLETDASTLANHGPSLRLYVSARGIILNTVMPMLLYSTIFQL